MSTPAYPVLGSRISQLSNIPRYIESGYKQTFSGQVNYPDGSFMCYGSVAINGSDGNPINTRYEADANWSITLYQLPCDSAGNIVMTSYCLSPFKNDSVNSMRLMVFCKTKPTHRVVLATGEIIDDNTDNEYLREMIFSYSILQR